MLSKFYFEPENKDRESNNKEMQMKMRTIGRLRRRERDQITGICTHSLALANSQRGRLLQ